MDDRRVKELQTILNDIENNIGEKEAHKLQKDRTEQIIQRLAAYSSDCEECEKELLDLERHLYQLHDKTHQLTKDDWKEYYRITEASSTHLMDKHDLVSSGYYMSIGISLGMCFGLLFGLLFFDNIVVGLPIGMLIGIGIGANLDADANRKGRTF